MGLIVFSRSRLNARLPSPQGSRVLSKYSYIRPSHWHPDAAVDASRLMCAPSRRSRGGRML